MMWYSAVYFILKVYSLLVYSQDILKPPETSQNNLVRPDDVARAYEIVTKQELATFSEEVLRRDVNNAANYITVNYQVNESDYSGKRLLTVNPMAFKIPTVQQILHLHDNYIKDVKVDENVTNQELSEEENLLNILINTPVMNYTRQFLAEKGVIPSDVNKFKNILHEIWFTQYSRGGGKLGSSAFEHVFLSEIKKGKVQGLHNWVYFSIEENNGNVEFLGLIRKIDLKEKGSLLKFRFKLNGVNKPVNSIFVGTSPELEMALYTACFLLKPNRHCVLRLNGKKVPIRTYVLNYNGKKLIGSAYPDI